MSSRRTCQGAVVFVAVLLLCLTLISLRLGLSSSISNLMIDTSLGQDDYSKFSESRSECGLDDYYDPSETSTANSCDTIHLAVVCGRYNSTREFYVLLKSILFYRTDPIHLHLFVDEISRVILTKLLSTWQVPNLTHDFYNITQYEHEVSWIPNRHYSRRYGLMKMVFISVLAESQRELDNIIMLDTDMLALNNINRIWKQFAGENFDGAMGVVENQSSWYLSGNDITNVRYVWPALGRGYNTGLMMLNLERIRALDWGSIWRRVVEKELITRLSTTLADQDIINAVFKDNPSLVYTVPCTFNLQLNDHTEPDQACQVDKKDIVLIHWNSPSKLETKNTKLDYFRDWYSTFRDWDGKLLRRAVCIQDADAVMNSTQSVNTPTTIEEPICQDLRPRPHEILRTFPYFMPFEANSVDEYDLSIVVHLSIDRLRVLDDLASHWPGPISASIYMSEQETTLLLKSIEDSNTLVRRRNIGYHLVFRDHGFNYPINKLRNIALNNAITPYVFLIDVDFLPSLNAYDSLKKTLKDWETDEGLSLSRALVVPAFENLQYKFEFPTSKINLETQLNLGLVTMFREQIWPQGHAPTDYARWRVSSKPYRVDWRPDYEPFIVTHKGVPKFDERFVGFGWNKVEHIMQLAALQYEFRVVPDAFLIHQFHSASYDILKHRESQKYRLCIKLMKRAFLEELKQKHEEFFEQLVALTSGQQVNSTMGTN